MAVKRYGNFAYTCFFYFLLLAIEVFSNVTVISAQCTANTWSNFNYAVSDEKGSRLIKMGTGQYFNSINSKSGSQFGGYDFDGAGSNISLEGIYNNSLNNRSLTSLALDIYSQSPLLVMAGCLTDLTSGQQSLSILGVDYSNNMTQEFDYKLDYQRPSGSTLSLYSEVFVNSSSGTYNVLGNSNVFSLSSGGNNENLFYVNLSSASGQTNIMSAYKTGYDNNLVQVVKKSSTEYFYICNVLDNGLWKGLIVYIDISNSSNNASKLISLSNKNLKLVSSDYNSVTSELLVAANIIHNLPEDNEIILVQMDLSSTTFGSTSPSANNLGSGVSANILKYVGGGSEDYLLIGKKLEKRTKFPAPISSQTFDYDLVLMRNKFDGTSSNSYFIQLIKPFLYEEVSDLLIDGDQAVLTGTSTDYSNTSSVFTHPMSIGFNVCTGVVGCQGKNLTFSQNTLELSINSVNILTETASAGIDFSDNVSYITKENLPFSTESNCCSLSEFPILGIQNNSPCVGVPKSYVFQNVPSFFSIEVFWYLDDELVVQGGNVINGNNLWLNFQTVKEDQSAYILKGIFVFNDGYGNKCTYATPTLNIYPNIPIIANFFPDYVCYIPSNPSVLHAYATNVLNPSYNWSIQKFSDIDRIACLHSEESLQGGQTLILPSDLLSGSCVTNRGAGYYRIILNVTGTNTTCSTTVIKEFLIEDVTAEFGPTEFCFGDESNYFSFEGSKLTSNFLWQYKKNDGNDVYKIFSTEQEPEPPFSGPGSYVVKLTIQTKSGEACMDNKEHVVEVYGPEEADFSFEATSTSNELHFTPVSTNVSASHLWTIDENGTISTYTTASPNHVFSSSGNYKVCHRINLGPCSEEICKWVCPTGLPMAIITNPYTEFCLSNLSNTHIYTFTSGSTQAQSQKWFLNGIPLGIGTTQDLEFTEPGTYLLVLEVENSCGQQHQISKAELVIEVPPYPKVDFTIINTGLTLDLIAKGDFMPGTIFTWEIDGVSKQATDPTDPALQEILSSGSTSYGGYGNHIIKLTVEYPEPFKSCGYTVSLTKNICLKNSSMLIDCCNCSTSP